MNSYPTIYSKRDLAQFFSMVQKHENLDNESMRGLRYAFGLMQAEYGDKTAANYLRKLVITGSWDFINDIINGCTLPIMECPENYT